MKPANRELKFKQRSVKSLTNDPRNPRVRIAGHERERLKASIERWGFVVPILISDGVIVDGHQRLDVARELGMSKVPVVDLGNMTDTERIALNVATDRIRTDFDPRKVLSVIEEFKVKQPELATLTGFTDADLLDLKEMQEKLDAMDTSFLDEFNPSAGDLMAGDQYESGEANDRKGQTSDKVRLHFVLTTSQRDTIVEKLTGVKDTEGLDSMADALWHLAK